MRLQGRHDFIGWKKTNMLKAWTSDNKPFHRVSQSSKEPARERYTSVHEIQLISGIFDPKADFCNPLKLLL